MDRTINNRIKKFSKIRSTSNQTNIRQENLMLLQYYTVSLPSATWNQTVGIDHSLQYKTPLQMNHSETISVFEELTNKLS